MPASLLELGRVFLKLGTISFGGPAAHIALMEDEVVRRRQWISREEFLDLLGATNLIPGPNSTEMAIFIGRRMAGWRGLLVAGIAFILPASLIVTAFAWFYVTYGSLPQVDAILYGTKPVIIAIVLHAVWGLGAAALKSRELAVLAAVGTVLNYAGLHELVILFGSGLLYSLVKAGRSHFVNSLFVQVAGNAGIATMFSLGSLFLFFLKTGAVLFGSGYVLLAFLRADLVDRWGWLTEGQLLDAIVVGQVTPGPLFTTATFIGYVLDGIPGAAVATIGIFIPAFLFVAISAPLISRIRRSLTAGAFLDGVNAASLALMAVVLTQLAHSAVVDATTLILSISAAVIVFRFRVNSAWLVLAGAAVGVLTMW